MAMPFCLYNHSQQLEGRADGTTTYPRNPIHVEGNYYKREWRETEGAGTPPQEQTRGTGKNSSFHAEDQSFLKNSVHLSLIVENTVITVVHILKPSSLARSLQIHCTGLTGLRSHTSWAGLEKCDPTIGAVCRKGLCVSKCND